MPKRTNRKYYFSVEGETEEWYLQHVKQLINNDLSAIHSVVIDCKKEKNPIKRAKSLVALDKTIITHWFDYESEEEVHKKQFRETLDALKEASSIKKQIKYNLVA